MFCKNCGEEIKEGSLFCANCGTGVQGDRTEKVLTDVENQPSEGMGKKQSLGKRKKVFIVIVVSMAVLLLAAGTAAGVFYFTSDGYVGRKNLELAKKCYEEEEYKDALSYCKKALERNPSLTDVYLLQADILLAEQNYEEAVQNLEKGLKRTKQNEKAQAILAEKIDEVNRAEAAAVTACLQEYLDRELTPQYGYAQLDSQVKEIDLHALSTYGPSEESMYWTGVNGIVFAQICDWDGDGRDELLTMVQGNQNKSLCVYELEDGNVVKKSECLTKRSDDLAESDEIWILLDVESGRYLYYAQAYHGVMSEDNYGVSKLYRYDGKKLYTPLTFEYDSDPVSSDCTAFQYNENGEMLLSEGVYSFLHDGPDYELTLNREYCEGRITELFAEYGIVWDSDENTPAADNGNKELARFCVWLERSNRYPDKVTYRYHFNDWDSPLPVYERFLQGKETLHMRGELGSSWFGDGREEWTFQDLLESVKHSYLEYSAQEISGVEYAFMDCGEDGVEEMLLRFIWKGPNRREPWDDGAQTAVIFCRSGELELVYMDEAWERAVTDIDYYGCINSFISPHMGLAMSSQQYIDGNGDLQTVYSKEELWGQELSYLSETAYNEAFAEISEYEPYMGIGNYEIKGEEYYVLYEGEDTEECRNFISLCENEGKRFVKEEEVESLIKQRLEELGVKETWKNGNGLTWNSCVIENNADRKLVKRIIYENGDVREYNYVYTYDSSGKVTERTLYYSDGTINSTVVYSYDDQGNLTEEFGAIGEEQASSYSYSYDSQGRVLNEWRRYYGDIEYSYDSQGKLVKETHYENALYSMLDLGADGVTKWYDYHYDEQGNLTEKIQHINDAVKDMTDREEYICDAQGNLAEMNVHREREGSRQDYRYVYGYDAQGNKIKETRYTDGGSNIGGWTEYSYDGWGDLTKETDYDGDGRMTRQIEYIYASDNS